MMPSDTLNSTRSPVLIPARRWICGGTVRWLLLLIVPAAIFLLSKGADANAHGPGYAALHWAAGSWETQLTGPYGIESHREDEWNAMRGLKGAARLQLIDALLTHGADPSTGSGLRGLADRVAVLDGSLRIESPRAGGTRVVAEIPLESK